MTEQQNAPAEGDLLVGMEAIAKHLGIGWRQVEHLKARHGLPTFKMGRAVCASKLRLKAHLQALCDAVGDEIDTLEGTRPGA